MRLLGFSPSPGSQKQLLICGGWSEPLGQPQLLDWRVCLNPTAKAAAWHVQLGSHCLSWNELLGLLYRVSALQRVQKTAGRGGVVVCGTGCCKEGWKEGSADAVAWCWRQETAVWASVSPEVDHSELLWSYTWSCVAQGYCCLPYLG